MNMITESQLQAILDEQFGGKLEAGTHPHRKACSILELHASALGLWTDDPKTLDDWDLRPLNNIPGLDPTVRVNHLIPVLARYMGSRDWHIEKEVWIVERLAILTVQRVIAELPYLNDVTVQQCRDARTLEASANAAFMAGKLAGAAGIAAWRAGSERETAGNAAHAAWNARVAVRHAQAAGASWPTHYALQSVAGAAEESANIAARAVGAAARAAVAAEERIFIMACALWVEAAESVPENLR